MVGRSSFHSGPLEPVEHLQTQRVLRTWGVGLLISSSENPTSGQFGEWKPYLHLHSVLVRLPGSERETPKHFRFQRRIHQLLRDDQLLDLGRGVGARVFEHR